MRPNWLSGSSGRTTSGAGEPSAVNGISSSAPIASKKWFSLALTACVITELGDKVTSLIDTEPSSCRTTGVPMKSSGFSATVFK